MPVIFHQNRSIITKFIEIIFDVSTLSYLFFFALKMATDFRPIITPLQIIARDRQYERNHDNCDLI